MELVIQIVRMLAMVTADVLFPIVVCLHACVMQDSLVIHAIRLRVIIIAVEMEIV
jgi:hypothetical protein